jgi:hypothetical protein
MLGDKTGGFAPSAPQGRANAARANDYGAFSGSPQKCVGSTSGVGTARLLRQGGE